MKHFNEQVLKRFYEKRIKSERFKCRGCSVWSALDLALNREHCTVKSLLQKTLYHYSVLETLAASVKYLLLVKTIKFCLNAKR